MQGITTTERNDSDEQATDSDRRGAPPGSRRGRRGGRGGCARERLRAGGTASGDQPAGFSDDFAVHRGALQRYKDAVVERACEHRRRPGLAVRGQAPGEATGSGFVIDEEGRIVTNQHVADNAQSVQVEFSDGTEVDAEIVGTDPSTDVAVLDVDRPSPS